MPIELSDTDGPLSLEFELHGQLSTDDLSRIVDQLDDDDAIQKMSIEIAAENPAALDLPALEHHDSDRETEVAEPEITVHTDNSPSTELSESEDGHQPATSTDSPSEQIPRLHPGGDPFAIMRLMAHQDGWLRTQEIAEAIPDEWDISENALGSNLWTLVDRGLLNKRPYEDDNRQNEYRITTLGEDAVDHAVDRAEELQPIELS